MTKKVGLALGAGGVKGIAHIGVIQVLEENGVPIDIISGSSAGAIIGAIYASGTDLCMLGKFISSVNSREYLDMALPRSGGGLVKGERMQELVRLFTHNKTFEETVIPFLCIAVDVETGELVTFSREKKLHECVRASMSIPGVFVPVRIDGKLCVDGGVLERVPCIPLREAGADVVIGVDVGYRGEIRPINQPTMRNIIDNTLEIMRWEIARLRLQEADIMLCPRTFGFMHGFSTENTVECIAEGRRAALEAMPKIKALLEKEGIKPVR